MSPSLTSSDALCQDAPEQGIVPPGTYVAWLSTGTKDAKDRLPFNPDGWVLPDGTTKIADDLADLIDGNIQNVINQTEFGIVIGANEITWTGTTKFGLAT